MYVTRKSAGGDDVYSMSTVLNCDGDALLSLDDLVLTTVYHVYEHQRVSEKLRHIIIFSNSSRFAIDDANVPNSRDTKGSLCS